MTITRHQVRTGRLGLSGLGSGTKLPLSPRFASVAGLLGVNGSGGATKIQLAGPPSWSGIPATIADSQGSSANIAVYCTGAAPLTFTVAPSSAALPTGATLSSGGLITVNLTAPVGTTSGIVIRATDVNSQFTDSPAFSLQITAVSTFTFSIPSTFVFTEGVPSSYNLMSYVTGNPALLSLNKIPAEELVLAGITYNQSTGVLSYDGSAGIGYAGNYILAATSGEDPVHELILPYSALRLVSNKNAGYAGCAQEGSFGLLNSAFGGTGLYTQSPFGDWWDSTMTRQGSIPWYTWTITGTAGTVVTKDVTAMVQAWQAGIYQGTPSPNLGFFFIASNAAFTLPELSPSGGPFLNITFKTAAPVSILAQCASAFDPSGLGKWSQSYFPLGSPANSVLFFDITPYTDVILSATISGTLYNNPNNSTAQIYMTRWEGQVAGTPPTLGIAWNYANEVGIAADPNVVGTEVNPDTNYNSRGGWLLKTNYIRDSLVSVVGDTDADIVYPNGYVFSDGTVNNTGSSVILPADSSYAPPKSGIRSMKLAAGLAPPQGPGSGGIAGYYVFYPTNTNQSAPDPLNPPAANTHFFARWLTRMSSNFDIIIAGKLSGIDGTYGGSTATNYDGILPQTGQRLVKTTRTYSSATGRVSGTVGSGTISAHVLPTSNVDGTVRIFQGDLVQFTSGAASGMQFAVSGQTMANPTVLTVAATTPGTPLPSAGDTFFIGHDDTVAGIDGWVNVSHFEGCTPNDFAYNPLTQYGIRASSLYYYWLNHAGQQGLAVGSNPAWNMRMQMKKNRWHCLEMEVKMNDILDPFHDIRFTVGNGSTRTTVVSSDLDGTFYNANQIVGRYLYQANGTGQAQVTGFTATNPSTLTLAGNGTSVANVSGDILRLADIGPYIVSNGTLRIWMDGRLGMEFTDVKFRRSPNSDVWAFQLQYFAQGSPLGGSNANMTLFHSQFVFANAYVGPPRWQ